MKAIRYHGPRDLRYEDVRDPDLGPDDVLIKVKAAGVCGTDIEVYDGTMFYIAQNMTRVPFVPGHEWAGEVVGLGENVTEFERGERVTGECSVGCRSCSYCLRGWYNQCPNRTETGLLNREGCFAEYIAFPKQFLHRCNDLDFEEAAFVEPTGVALHATKRAQVGPEDYTVVMGAGPIGLFAAQTARAYGARKVIVVDIIESRLAKGIEVGADAAIDSSAPDYVERIRDATNGHLADVVIEAAGRAAAWERIPPILSPRARVAMTGLFGGERCSVDFDPLVLSNSSILGCLGGPAMWDEAIDLLQRGKVSAAPLITHRLPLRKLVDAVQIVRRRQDDAVKVVVQP